MDLPRETPVDALRGSPRGIAIPWGGSLVGSPGESPERVPWGDLLGGSSWKLLWGTAPVGMWDPLELLFLALPCGGEPLI